MGSRSGRLSRPGRVGRALRVFLPLLWLLVACSAPPPAPKVTVGCDPSVPDAVCSRLQDIVRQDAAHFTWMEEPAAADVRLGGPALANARPVGTWTYAVVAPFFTVDDDVASEDLIATWRGTPSGPFAAHSLLATPETLRVLSEMWGPPPASAPVAAAGSDELLERARQAGAWAIVPFEQLQSGWKVLRVDGISLLEKGLEGDTGAVYPLQVRLVLGSERHPEVLPPLNQGPDLFTNRQEAKMTVLAMTGVTALVRTTAQIMEEQGITYPARDIKTWLTSADLTHISNEIAFTPDCPVPPIQDTMTFCSHDRYIKLLEEVGTDVVELTGNHMNDYGNDALRHTLDMYRERGWHWYAGGENLAEATRPLTITVGPNRLAFLGCNPVGPSYDWATEVSPGSAPCDLERMKAQIRELRAEGYLPIVTFQYEETYEYLPTPQQVADFRAMADAGAAVVQGSQAHQPQAIEFYNGAFIHYGLGNLFFDQMQTLGTRQEFVDRLVFYDGRLVSIDLRTALLEEYARPRPMTVDERRDFLKTIFDQRLGTP